MFRFAGLWFWFASPRRVRRETWSRSQQGPSDAYSEGPLLWGLDQRLQARGSAAAVRGTTRGQPMNSWSPAGRPGRATGSARRRALRAQQAEVQRAADAAVRVLVVLADVALSDEPAPLGHPQAAQVGVVALEPDAVCAERTEDEAERTPDRLGHVPVALVVDIGGLADLELRQVPAADSDVHLRDELLGAVQEGAQEERVAQVYVGVRS